MGTTTRMWKDDREFPFSPHMFKLTSRRDKSARKRMRQYNVGHSNRQQSAPLTSHSHSAQDTSRDGSRVSHDSGTTFKFLPVAGANLSWSANQSILTESLVRVYRDSMENALSCWLTERTCPYVGKQLPFGLCTPGPTEGEEWGPVWTNRICTRVCRLDRAAATIRGRPLTLKEERAASRALHSTIMAFSTQWAQSKARCTTYFPSFVGEEACSSASKSINPEFNTEHRTSLEVNDSGPTSTLSLDFEQSMQETFWHQARQALQDSADVDSFRVVFAHIIFSLTQKPNVEQKPGHLHSNTPPTQYNSSSIGGITAGMDELELIVDSDGPPIFLEMAMRQLFSYRCKLERMERQKITGLRNANSSPHHRTEVLSYEDRQTFDLLFWLGVMFDTLSSAMHKRPLVVSDEDSDILSDASSDSAYSSAPETTYRMECMRKSESKLWGQFFLQQKQFESGDGVIRWPCPIERAAIALSDAAPVKVLLFRKVTYLQTLLSRQVKDERLEDAICDALSVHKHWNDIYGSFIMDCIANHDDLPPRIQSWYVVLAGHWHLAGLLLADLIESIDECGLGLESKQNLRLVSCLVPSLRTQNAYAISDLGRCSSPRSDSTFSKGREFHFAVNEGALLTEPWTAVLIRSFGKAGYLLLDWTTFDDNERGAKARCEDCIQALWYLGRKSNMAMKVAEALSNAMKAKVFRPATENTAGSLMGPAPDSLQPDCDFEWQESMAEFMPIPPLGVEMIGMRFDEFI